MIDLRVLAKMGSTNERLREVMTARNPEEKDSQEIKDRKKRDMQERLRIETRIADRLQSSVSDSLANSDPFIAIDLAWDSTPITKEDIPLLQYAMGKLNLRDCAASLSQLKASQYIKLNDKKEVVGIDLPAFIEANVPLLRSMVSRRLAAQANKYNGLYPFYKYQARSTGQPAKLCGDVISEAVEVIVDSYGYRHHDVQVERDMYLYGHSVDFVRASWERERQIHFSDSADEDSEHESIVEREGVVFVNPHPTRTFKDPSHPWSSLNTDSGMAYCGYWDVVRWGTIRTNPEYYNTDCVTYGTAWCDLFATYSNYWRQYYCTLTPPTVTNIDTSNDAKSAVGRYTSEQDDAATLIAVYYEKIRPLEYGIGRYPEEVWVRFVTAGTSGTVINAEFLPSRPGACCSFNENDNRARSVSFAMDMLTFQDQITNLYRQLLAVCAIDQLKLIYADTDAIAGASEQDLRRRITGAVQSAGPLLITYSSSAYTEKGIDPKNALGLVQANVQPQSIQLIFQAIVQTVSLAERIAAMSANELGQPIVRSEGGVTATEAGQIEASSSAMYNFAADGIDEFREAKKRILFESWINCAESDEFELPVTRRYAPSIVAAAGLEIVDGPTEINAPARWTVRGNKWKLLSYDYVFSSRDGAERAVNTQAATTLVQLVPMLQTPAIANKVPTSKIIEIFNEIFRLSGAGVDLVIDPEEEEAPQSEIESLKQGLASLAQTVTMLAKAQGGGRGGAQQGRGPQQSL